MKLRLGYTTLEADLAAVRAVRKSLPDTIALMTDCNQALSVAEAICRGRTLDDEGLYWTEEPLRHDDYLGCARLLRELKTPVQIGENFSQPQAMEQSLAANASGFMMPDLEHIGGGIRWNDDAVKKYRIK